MILVGSTYVIVDSWHLWSVKMICAEIVENRTNGHSDYYLMNVSPESLNRNEKHLCKNTMDDIFL